MAKRRLLLGLAAGCLVVGGFFAAGPYIALHRVRSAAESGDAEALSEYIDFARVRTNVKMQLRGSIQRKLPAEHTALGMVGAAVAGTLLDPMVDSVISPETIGSWIRESPSGKGPTDATDAKTQFVSWSEFRATLKYGKEDVDLVFTREYLRWRLTDIRIDWSLTKLMPQLPSLPTIPQLQQLVPQSP